jgi:hypothetical protein
MPALSVGERCYRQTLWQRYLDGNSIEGLERAAEAQIRAFLAVWIPLLKDTASRSSADPEVQGLLRSLARLLFVNESLRYAVKKRYPGKSGAEVWPGGVAAFEAGLEAFADWRPGTVVREVLRSWKKGATGKAERDAQREQLERDARLEASIAFGMAPFDADVRFNARCPRAGRNCRP